jgi:hypothetical protein
MAQPLTMRLASRGCSCRGSCWRVWLSSCAETALRYHHRAGATPDVRALRLSSGGLPRFVVHFPQSRSALAGGCS